MAKMVSSLFLLVWLCSCVHVCMLPFFGLGDGGRDPAPLRLALPCLALPACWCGNVVHFSLPLPSLEVSLQSFLKGLQHGWSVPLVVVAQRRLMTGSALARL